IDSIDEVKARSIEVRREKRPFRSIQDLARRTGFTNTDLQLLASADALRNIAGNRHEARWQAAAVKPSAELLELAEESTRDDLLTPPPTAQKEMLEDFATIGHTLRAHPMTFLRNDLPFQRCTLSRDLVNRRSG